MVSLEITPTMATFNTRLTSQSSVTDGFAKSDSKTNSGKQFNKNENELQKFKSGNFDKIPVISERDTNIDWFIQVSDIHISKFYDRKRGPDLKYFIQNNVQKIIKPNLVLVTGDITDAKFADLQGSKQFTEEWKIYSDILTETSVTNNIPWLDIRGNHDAFDVSALNGDDNLFRIYSKQGREHTSSYKYIYTSKDGVEITFIAVDACPNPGPKRPFNFFGVLTEQHLNKLIRFRDESVNSNLTIWFGHYPTSIIWNPRPGIRHIMKNSIYMSGHLHNLAGFLPSMYTVHKEGLLELELADWKDNRMYRVFAVDHGLFSFTDVTLHQWPVILITNPKHALFSSPQFEPTYRIKTSQYIRVLVFSSNPIVKVMVYLNNIELGVAKTKSPPLYTIQWNPDLFPSGIHNIEIYAEDALRQNRTVSQPFTLDDSRLKFGLFQRYVLMMDQYVVLRLCFFALLLLASFPLVLLKVLDLQFEVTHCGNKILGKILKFAQNWVRRISVVAKTNKLFYPLVMFNLYVAIGPWFIGEVLSGHIGAMFVWGIYVQGTIIPGTLTYVYGFFQILFFNIPLTLYLAVVRNNSISAHKHSENHTNHRISCCNWIKIHVLFVILIVFQSYLAIFGFYRSYGLMSLIFCPVRTWSIPLAFYLRYVAITSI